MAMSVLVIGSSGQVATELTRRAHEGRRIRALDRRAADLSDPKAAAAAVARQMDDVDVVINAAAYTAVDRAEEESDLAMRINGAAPGEIARVCAARGAPLLHISTDYVFDGRGDAPWREDDPTAPLGAYGRSKLAGEQAVAESGVAGVILRTAWVHAGHGRNFVRAMLSAAQTRDELKVVDDQKGGPTAAGDIAETLLSIAERFAAGRGVDGIFHYCGAPVVSWRGFAEEIFRQAAWSPQPRITAIAGADWPAPAPRPTNSALDCAKISRVFGIAQPDWRRSLAGVLEQLRPDGAQRA